jgi:hypothetical protein
VVEAIHEFLKTESDRVKNGEIELEEFIINKVSILSFPSHQMSSTGYSTASREESI